MARGPDWWLQRLTTRLDLKRGRLDTLRAYLEGNAPLPEGAEGCRDAYKLFQRKARTNFAELVVDSAAERMRVSGFIVGETNEDDDQARQIWDANNLDTWSTDVHRDMLGLGEAAVMVSPGEGEGVIDITSERPEQVITEADPRRPDRVRAALKVYRDEAEGFDFAYLHLPGRVYLYSRKVPDSNLNPLVQPTPRFTVVGGWPDEADSVEETGISTVPVVPFFNRLHMGDFETHTDLLDRINWVVLQRLVITAMQAYRQRATKGDLPESDESGNPIDYSEIFRPGPGALWQLPEGVELWESGETDIRQILEEAKDDIRHLAALTRTPVSVLLPDGANQTAEGAAFAREGLIYRTEDRMARAGASWTQVMRLAFELSGLGVPDIQTRWRSAERQSMAERYDAASKAGPAGVPWRTTMIDVLGFPPDQVDRMEAERAADDMRMALLAPPTTPEPNAAPGAAEGGSSNGQAG